MAGQDGPVLPLDSLWPISRSAIKELDNRTHRRARGERSRTPSRPTLSLPAEAAGRRKENLAASVGESWKRAYRHVDQAPAVPPNPGLGYLKLT
jgi:hypothetical protein